MMDEYTKAAMAYLDEAEPMSEPWSYEDARRWLEHGISREAKALRAALAAIGIHP